MAGGFSQYDKDMGAENRLRSPPDFDGPTKSRKVTDPLCALLLIAAWGCFAYLGYWSYVNGNPIWIIHPSDYKGRLCGVDRNATGDTLPSHWAPTDYLANGICVEACPEKTNFNADDRGDLTCKDDEDLIEMSGCSMNGTIVSDINLLVICGGCMYKIKSVDALDYCLPTSVDVLLQINKAANATGYNPLEDLELDLIIPRLQRFASDIWTARLVVAGGIGGSAVLGFLVLILMRFSWLVSIVTWTSALSIPALTAFAGYVTTLITADYKADTTAMYSENLILAMEFTTYGLYGLAGIMLCALCFLRERIGLAIGVTKAGARSVVAIPMSTFYPLIQLIGFIIFLAAWFVVLAFLASTGVPVEVTRQVFNFEISYSSYDFSQEAVYGFCYMIFILFWTSAFIVAMGQITLSLCFSKWYFTVDRSSGIDVTLIGAMCTTICKHMGTAAFGSLIIAIIQCVRVALQWVQKKIKDSGAANKCTDVLICCCQCCLCCLEKCVKYISKNAYTQTAIFGYGFCKGAHEAFNLILRNALRMSAVGLVSELSSIFMKLFVVAGVSTGSYLAMEEFYGHDLFSVIGVVLLIAIISWFVADMFTGVLGIAVTTILQCFLVDEEMFGGTGSYFVPDELDDFINKVDYEATKK